MADKREVDCRRVEVEDYDRTSMLDVLGKELVDLFELWTRLGILVQEP